MKNLSELRAILLKEHARDRRLTLINYFLILCLIALVLGLLFYIGVDFKGIFTEFINQNNGDNSLTALYPIIATIVGFTCVCGYPFYVLLKVNKRPKRIDAVIERAEKGAKLAGVNDYVEYKITIPLLKLNLKICPVTFTQISFEGDYKPYILPIRPSAIADMKILLSGVNMEDISRHKEALYADTSEETDDTNFIETPIKTVDEFRTFLDSELKEDIESLESSRKSSYKTMIIGGILAGIFIVAVMGYVFYNSFTKTMESDYTFNPLTTIVPIFALGIVVTIIINIVMKKRASGQATTAQTLAFGNNTFKEKIISRMVTFVNPSVKYIPMGHLSLDDIFESGLFEQRNYTLSGSDQISGKHNGVPFIMCDLSMQFKRNFSDENEQADSVFYGQFFVARFNKQFSQPVYVISTGKTGDARSYLTSDMGEQVKLEDPEFMKMYRVYAHDQVEARYILTPSLMERLKELAKRTKGTYLVAFYNNKITVANNSRINNFETGFSKSLTSKENELLVGFYTDLCNQFAIIDELKLNINIWKKL